MSDPGLFVRAQAEAFARRWRAASAELARFREETTREVGRLRDALRDVQLREGPPGRLEEAVKWEARAWSRGRCVVHRGGLWQAHRDTEDEPGTEQCGWHPIALGVDGLSVARDADDEGLYTLSLHQSDGAVSDFDLEFSLPRHVGPYRDGLELKAGHECGFEGATWRARCDAPDGPPPGDDWTLVAKPGERGKRGYNGRSIDAVHPVDKTHVEFELEDGTRLGPVELPRGERGRPGTHVTGVVQTGADRIRFVLSSGRQLEEITLPAGEKGESGDSWTFRGEWTPGTRAERNDVFTHASALWIARAPTNTAPSATSSAWEVLLRVPTARGRGGGGLSAQAVDDRIAARALSAQQVQARIDARITIVRGDNPPPYDPTGPALVFLADSTDPELTDGWYRRDDVTLTYIKTPT